MGATTTYDVLLRYRLDNQATADAEKLRHKLGEAGHASSELSHLLGHLGAIAGGAMSIHGAWEHLVKFNSEVENAKISLTAMVEGGFGGSFEYAKGQAESLYKEFQKFSTQTPMTTQEMLEFSRGVAVSTQQAGGSIQDIVTITEQGAIAAKALGMESHYASRELSEMLSGNINNRMLFAKQLAGLGGKTTEELRAMGAGERLEFVKRTLQSPAMKDAVSAMSSSFSGVTSTLIDKLQILLGKVGLPLFKAITAEVSRWNQWIDKNDAAINHFASEVGSGLVHAFEIVKDVFAFIYDHADTFLAIGKIWAAIKISNMIGGALGGGGGSGGVTGFIGQLGSNVGGGKGAAPLQTQIAAALVAYEAGHKLGESINDLSESISGNDLAGAFRELGLTATKLDQSFNNVVAASEGVDKFYKEQNERGNTGAQGAAQATDNMFYQRMKVLKAMVDETNNGGLDINNAKSAKRLAEVGLTPEDIRRMGGLSGAMSETASTMQGDRKMHELAATEAAGFLGLLERSSLTEYQRQTLNEMKAQDQVFAYLNSHLARGLKIDMGEILNIIKGNTADPEGKHKAITEKPKVNVTIHRIEVQSDDPDRYAFRFVEAFRQHNKSPSQAVSALREG